MNCEILTGDCREVLADLEDGSVNCCVTSPPYFGLRDYGVDGQIGLEQTPDAYVAELVRVFREVKRVLRDDATLWLNLGDTYASGNTSPASNRHPSRGQKGVVHVKEMTQDARPTPLGLKPKDLIGIPWRVAFALQADGWYLRQDIIWAKPNPMPESVTDRCTKSHEYIFLLSKSARYCYDAAAIAEQSTQGDDTVRDRSDSKINNGTGLAPHGDLKRNDYPTRNKRSVWTVATQPYKGAHFATFPPDLIKPCILAGCPAGGTVLDCFGGSGTTGAVAESLGRNSVLIELKPEYGELQRARTAQRSML